MVACYLALNQRRIRPVYTRQCPADPGARHLAHLYRAVSYSRAAAAAKYSPARRPAAVITKQIRNITIPVDDRDPLQHRIGTFGIHKLETPAHSLTIDDTCSRPALPANRDRPASKTHITIARPRIRPRRNYNRIPL